MTSVALKRMFIALTLLAASGVATMASAQRGGIGRGMGMGGRGRMGNGRGAEIREFVARIQTRTYVFPETGERLEYNVFVSSKVDSRKPSPLVIALHGLGVQPGMMIRTLGREADERGYILAAPTGYTLQGWYGAAGPTSERTTPANLGELSEKDVLHVLENMRREFNIDDRRIYLVGQSMGGAGALHLAIKYPDIWAAVAAAAPALREQQQPAQLEFAKHLPIILVHGEDDLAVPVELSRLWAAKMKELKMTYEYREVRGGSHGDALPENVDRVFGFFGKHRKPVTAGAPLPAAVRSWTLQTPDVVELEVPDRIRALVELDDRADKVIKGAQADLNGDGTDDYIVQGTMCGTGGCPYVVYNGRTNAKIGDVFGSMIIVRAETTRDFANIDTYSHLSAQAGTVTSFIFDGESYVVRSRQQAEGQLVQDLFAGWNQIPRWLPRGKF